jgi:hypothetical protein
VKPLRELVQKSAPDFLSFRSRKWYQCGIASSNAYFDVDLEIVWTTIEDDLPSVLLALDEALAEMDR